MTGYAVLLLTLAATAAAGALWAVRRGRLREMPAPEPGDLRLDQGALRSFGIEPGERATLVQVSSAFCAPCRATRRVLTDVAAMVPGVTYGEIDAEANLDAVRRMRILRTPTTLVVDPNGRVVVRASGAPRKADVVAALGRLLAPELQSR